MTLRTAAPPSISGAAEILALGPRGYRTAVKGTNGFVCLVDRAWSKPFDDPEFWNPKMRAPECVNAVAARSVLPLTLDRARWAVTGVPKAEIMTRTHAAGEGARTARRVYSTHTQSVFRGSPPAHSHKMST